RPRPLRHLDNGSICDAVLVPQLPLPRCQRPGQLRRRPHLHPDRYGASAMNPAELNTWLSLQPTIWSVVVRAHYGPADDQLAARRLLVEYYGGAVRRHLSQVLRDPEAVSELYQEVALRIMSGAFRRADPARGRFRDYLKT